MREFAQAQLIYKKMDSKEKEEFLQNVTESLMFEEPDVRETIVSYWGRIDKNLEKLLRKNLRF